MKKWISTLLVSIGLPVLLGFGMVALGAVIAPNKAEAGCYTVRTKHCTYSYGRRYCRYRRHTRCTRSRHCYWRRQRVRRRYCTTRYRRGYRSRYCSYRTYWRRYRVCN